MTDSFDPYVQWLGIRDPERPPNHYRLLGLELFESDPEVIANAADRQMAYVRMFQNGPRAAVSQRILNEIAAAKVCLLNPESKAAYDAQLRMAQVKSMPPLSSVAPEGVAPDAPVVSLDDEIPLPRTGGPQPWIAYLVAGSFSFALLAGGFYLLLGGRSAPPQDATLSQPAAPSPAAPDSSNDPAVPDAPTTSASASSDDVPVPAEPIGGPETSSDTPTPPSEPIGETTETVDITQISDFDTAVDRLREAMADRDVELARHLYPVVEQWAQSSEQRSKLDELKLLYEAWRSFWRFAASGLEALTPGTTVDIDGEQAVVVENTTERLVVQRENEQAEYALTDLPPELLVRLAETKLPEGPSRLLAVACFWHLDRDGSPDRARDAVLVAVDAGFPRDNLPAELSAVIDDDATAPESPSEPPQRIPIPVDENALAAKRAEIRDVYAAEYRELTSETDISRRMTLHVRFGERLLADAKATEDDPIARYALFDEAITQGLLGGNSTLVELAVREMCRYFEAEFLDVLTDHLVDSPSGMAGPARVAAARSALRWSQNRFSADDFDAASVLADAAYKHAMDARDTSLMRQSRDLINAIPRRKAEFEAFRDAQTALQQNPDDAGAKSVVGRYYCFTKHDWKRGLAFLAEGDQESLRTLAVMELDAQEHLDADTMTALCEAWHEAAVTAGNGGDEYLAAEMDRRALYWGEQALPQLSGFSQKKLERRLNEIRARLERLRN
ncbi:hypothetical protein JCM19992_11170 [Thermostilla marina]